MADIISLFEYKRACAMKCSFTGYVYDPKGWLFHVKTRNMTRQTSRPSFPNQNSFWYTNGTIFYEHFQSTEITLQEIGSDDVVYDEKGNFVCTRPASNKDRKGQIYIWKQKELRVPYQNPGELVNEYIPIQDLVLQPEVYSKLFTHLVSLEFKNDFCLLQNKIIMAQVRHPEYIRSYIHPQWEYDGENASYSQAIKSLVAVVKVGDSKDNNTELYSTIWNILNLLGAHELVGHGVMNWWSDKYSSHHITYLYQMGHPTFKNTTRFFQKQMERTYKEYIREVDPGDLKDEYRTREQRNSNILREHGFYPEKIEKLNTFTNRMLYQTQDTATMKRLEPDGLIERWGSVRKKKK